VPKKSKPAKRRPQVGGRAHGGRAQAPLYKQKPPSKVGTSRCDVRTAQRAVPTNDFVQATPIAPAHFALREDGSIQSHPQIAQSSADSKNKSASIGEIGGQPCLVFSSETPFVRLYHGNCLELLDAIAAKYPDDRFDAIFADPPYFLSNGGITCHAGKMIRVDKDDWEKSRGPELNHEFNLEWLARCQRILKPNGTISRAEVQRGSVVHTTVDVSLQEACMMLMPVPKT
jgi:hypothetical protein